MVKVRSENVHLPEPPNSFCRTERSTYDIREIAYPTPISDRQAKGPASNGSNEIRAQQLAVGPKLFVWQWGRFGAGPRLAYELAETLRSKNDVSVLLSLAEDAELLTAPACRNAVDVPVKTYTSLPQFATRTLRISSVLGPLASQLEEHRPNVAIAVMPGYWDMFVVTLLRRMDIPVIAIVHDAESHLGDSVPVLRMVQKRMVSKSEAIITLTDHVSQSLRSGQNMDNKLCLTIPHPALLFPDRNLPAPVHSEYSADRSLRLLLTGRLRRYKGIELLLGALERIQPARIDVRITGSLADKSLLVRASKLPNVTMMDEWTSEDDFVSHIDWSDIVVLPYVEASQSGIIPTAYARGKPVIVTPVGGLPEQVEHRITGLVTRDISSRAIEEAIRVYLTKPELLASMSRNARLQAEGNFSWESFGTELVQVASHLRN